MFQPRSFAFNLLVGSRAGSSKVLLSETLKYSQDTLADTILSLHFLLIIAVILTLADSVSAQLILV